MIHFTATEESTTYFMRQAVPRAVPGWPGRRRRGRRVSRRSRDGFVARALELVSQRPDRVTCRTKDGRELLAGPHQRRGCLLGCPYPLSSRGTEGCQW